MGYDKKRKRLPFSASHLMLYIVLGVYLLVAIFAILTVGGLLKQDYIEYGVQVLIGLFSFVGVCGSVSVSFYSWKAKAENEINSQNRKQEERLKMARQICDDLKDNTVDQQSILLLRALINDNNDNNYNYDYYQNQHLSNSIFSNDEETATGSITQTDFSVDDILNNMGGHG